MPNAKAAASRHACIFYLGYQMQPCYLRHEKPGKLQAELFAWCSIWVVFRIPSMHHHDSRDPLDLFVFLCLSVSRLIRSALMPWHDEHQQGVGLACLLYLWPFDLLNNLPGIWYYDVTMEAVRQEQPNMQTYNTSEYGCYLLHARAWISSQFPAECSRSALSLPAMNNWTIEDRVVYSAPCISDHDQIKFLPSNIVNLILNLDVVTASWKVICWRAVQCMQPANDSRLVDCLIRPCPGCNKTPGVEKQRTRDVTFLKIKQKLLS